MVDLENLLKSVGLEKVVAVGILTVQTIGTRSQLAPNCLNNWVKITMLVADFVAFCYLCKYLISLYIFFKTISTAKYTNQKKVGVH